MLTDSHECSHGDGGHPPQLLRFNHEHYDHSIDCKSGQFDNYHRHREHHNQKFEDVGEICQVKDQIHHTIDKDGDHLIATVVVVAQYFWEVRKSFHYQF